MSVRFKRWLGGACSVCLVQDPDGIEWALKLLSCGQEHTVSFAEAASYEIQRAVGLPCPAWRPIQVEKRHLLASLNLADLPDLCLAHAGPYFASRFIQQDAKHAIVIRTPAILPESRTLQRLLLGAYVYDVWAANNDLRQMLSALTWHGDFRLYLYDNSHVFGLTQDERPEWVRRRVPGGMPFRSLARMDGSDRHLHTWTRLLQEEAPHVLNTLEDRLPVEWQSTRTSGIRDTLMRRLDRLEELIVRDLFARDVQETGVDRAWDF